MEPTKTVTMTWRGSVMILMALLLCLATPATALLESAQEEVTSSSLECFDADCVRTGGFIWSDGLTASVTGSGR